MISPARLSASAILGRVARWPLRLVPSNATVPVLTGALRGARWVVGSGPHGCWLGTYERSSQQLAQRLVRPGDVVFDLGANVGFFTLLFSRKAGEKGRVVAYEPLERNRVALQRHLDLNRVRNVDVAGEAICDRAERARFSASFGPFQAGLMESGELEVVTSTLDEEVFEKGRPSPSLVKMDVEGAEHRILQGAVRLIERRPPVFWIETHGWRAHEDCRAMLEYCEFTLDQERSSDGSGGGRIVAYPAARADAPGSLP